MNLETEKNKQMLKKTCEKIADEIKEELKEYSIKNGGISPIDIMVIISNISINCLNYISEITNVDIKEILHFYFSNELSKINEISDEIKKQKSIKINTETSLH